MNILLLNKNIFSLPGDKFYADSYGSGVLLRGVLLHFLYRYDEAHEAFDEIIHMLVLLEKICSFIFILF
jgi:hypothetical protein